MALGATPYLGTHQPIPAVEPWHKHIKLNFSSVIWFASFCCCLFCFMLPVFCRQLFLPCPKSSNGWNLVRLPGCSFIPEGSKCSRKRRTAHASSRKCPLRSVLIPSTWGCKFCWIPFGVMKAGCEILKTKLRCKLQKLQNRRRRSSKS